MCISRDITQSERVVTGYKIFLPPAKPGGPRRGAFHTGTLPAIGGVETDDSEQLGLKTMRIYNKFSYVTGRIKHIPYWPGLIHNATSPSGAAYYGFHAYQREPDVNDICNSFGDGYELWRVELFGTITAGYASQFMSYLYAGTKMRIRERIKVVKEQQNKRVPRIRKVS